MSGPQDSKDPKNSDEESCWKLLRKQRENIGDVSNTLDEPHALQGREQEMSWLVNTIESEIIPRLVANHGVPVSAGLGNASLLHSEVEEFTKLALSRDAAACHHFVETVQARGVSLRAIYLDLLGPAARHLGELWTNDECDFTEITVALWRIQQVMYDLSPEFRRSGDRQHIGSSRKIMLAPVPGSQHTLGILMVAEFFRKAGWTVWGEPLAQPQELVNAVRDQWFDLVGISVGSEPQLETVKQLIAELRAASQNPSLLIMAGGPVIVHHPDYAQTIGADIHAIDAEDAVRAAEKAVPLGAAQTIGQQFFERGS